MGTIYRACEEVGAVYTFWDPPTEQIPEVEYSKTTLCIEGDTGAEAVEKLENGINYICHLKETVNYCGKDGYFACQRSHEIFITSVSPTKQFFRSLGDYLAFLPGWR